MDAYKNMTDEELSNYVRNNHADEDAWSVYVGRKIKKVGPDPLNYDYVDLESKGWYPPPLDEESEEIMRQVFKKEFEDE